VTRVPNYSPYSVDLHQKFIVNHYLRQFNEETIATKQSHMCGERSRGDALGLFYRLAAVIGDR